MSENSFLEKKTLLGFIEYELCGINPHASYLSAKSQKNQDSNKKVIVDLKQACSTFWSFFSSVTHAPESVLYNLRTLWMAIAVPASTSSAERSLKKL